MFELYHTTNDMAREKNSNSLAENRKARHDYFVEETIEAGIALVGTEVKSIRGGKCNLKDCYADIRNGEVFILNMHISPYEQGNIFNVDPLRERKLLLHKEQIGRLAGLVSRDGYTLVPLSLYLKNGRVKVALGICKGKKNYDKRDSMLEKAHKRDIERQMKERNRY
jgi:SsrA-binding protein